MRIKKFLLPLGLIVPIVLALVLGKPSPSSTQQNEINTPETTHSALPSLVSVSPQKKAPTIGQQNLQLNDDFDSALALTLLSEITLDENDAPVVNNQLKQQLDNAVRLIGRERSPAELDKLGQLISQTFKPHTAQTINHILLQYYAYKTAEEDYTTTLSVTSTADVTRNSKTLLNLRESYLGHELAEKLFGEDNTYHNYMAELTERLSPADLTEDMRINITNETRKKYYQEEIEGL
ncbi:MAG: lipase secretion chaperone [Cellvibrio sp.]